MPSTDFGPVPLGGADALARLKTLDPDEAHYDGNATLTLKAVATGAPEFPSTTSVYYLNGINNSMQDEIVQGATLADRIHGDVHLIHVATYGLSSDLEKSTGEKLDQSYAFAQPPERAVAAAVLAHVTGTPGAPAFSGDVHFAAYSRGALVTERGLELAQDDLQAAGYSKSQIAQLFSRIEVETFGGAASSFPEGVRALHYVNDHDPVALGFGMGPINGVTVEAVAAIGALNSYAGTFVAGYEIERALTLEPRGPVVLEKGKSAANPVDELLDAHSISAYLGQRTPFEQTREAALAKGHDVAAESRAGAVQTGVDRLRESGIVNLPDVARADSWNGSASSGTIVGLDGDHVAQHLGRGAYAIFDVARDLDGALPPDGRTATIGTDGRVATASPEIARAQ